MNVGTVTLVAVYMTAHFNQKVKILSLVIHLHKDHKPHYKMQTFILAEGVFIAASEPLLCKQGRQLPQ